MDVEKTSTNRPENKKTYDDTLHHISQRRRRQNIRGEKKGQEQNSWMHRYDDTINALKRSKKDWLQIPEEHREHIEKQNINNKETVMGTK